MGADGVVQQKERSCMGLGSITTREGYPPSDFAGADEVTRRIAAGEMPPNRPHEHLHNGGQNISSDGTLWTAFGADHGYDAALQEAIRADPVLRLFLRVATLEDELQESLSSSESTRSGSCCPRNDIGFDGSKLAWPWPFLNVFDFRRRPLPRPLCFLTFLCIKPRQKLS